MSKIGYNPITVPDGVNVTVGEEMVTVKGSRGELTVPFPKSISISETDGVLKLERASEKSDVRAMHGLIRAQIANAIHGVDKGWERRLEVVGTGYNVKLQGQDLVFKVGYSHPVVFSKVEGVEFKVEGNNKVSITGNDKQVVGQVAYQIKVLKKPDPYKGKGIRYEGEVVRLKAGKKAKA